MENKRNGNLEETTIGATGGLMTNLTSVATSTTDIERKNKAKWENIGENQIDVTTKEPETSNGPQTDVGGQQVKPGPVSNQD